MLIENSVQHKNFFYTDKHHDSQKRSCKGNDMIPLQPSSKKSTLLSNKTAPSSEYDVYAVIVQRDTKAAKQRFPGSKAKHPHYVRRRSFWQTLQMIIVALTVLCLVGVPSNVAAVPGTKWLQHRLRQIAAAHLDTPSKPLLLPPSAAPTSVAASADFGPGDSASRPLLVVSTNEGRVWTIDAADGSLVAGFSTGPPLLVIDDHYPPPASSDQEFADLHTEDIMEAHGEADAPPMTAKLTPSRIVPSIDGMLYWRQAILSSANGSPEDSSNNNADDGSKLVPIASIRDLVDNPIQLCQEVAGENCDILTATCLGPSLFSLNSQGSLNWARARSSTSFQDSQATVTTVNPISLQRESSSTSAEDNDSDSDSETSSDGSTSKRDSTTSLLLQRQDYLVEQISTKTGEQVWNMTWGSLEALDFEGGAVNSNSRRRRQHGESFHYLPSGKDDEMKPTSSLPSLMFSNQGKGLVALWAQPPKFLWKQGFLEMVTNVHGIEHDMWQTVNVVTEDDGYEHDQDDWHAASSSSNPKLHPRLTDKGDAQVEPEDIDRWYKWWATGGKQKLKLDGAEGKEGMMFVPGLNEHEIVRNSMYVNQLRDSSSVMREQYIQGYLAAHPHNGKGGHENSRLEERLLQPMKPDFLNNYGAARIPSQLFLPAADYTATTLPMTEIPGGVFLSWSLVAVISTILVGFVGAAYLLYGHKKRKWLSASSNDQDTIVFEGGVRSRSRAPSVSQDGNSGISDSNLDVNVTFSRSFLNDKFPRHTLNRSCSAPIMGDDLIGTGRSSSGDDLLSRTEYMQELSSNRRASTPAETNQDTGISPSAMVKHRSAPVESPVTLQQGGIGMIDGIPLIRYSRYQSEFKEIEPLGRGGFGSVFRVANVLDSREYAVKKVSIRSSDLHSPGTEAFSQELHRVLREVKFLALLDHPNIVRYYTAWLEMEEDDENVGIKASGDSKALSRRFSSGLLTSLDPTFGGEAASQTTQALLGDGESPSLSRATPSYLNGRSATNPLGWNNDFRNFEESSVSAAYHPKYSVPVLPSMEDCGFIFEEGSIEGDEEKSNSVDVGRTRPDAFYDRSHASSAESVSESHSLSSSWDASYSLNRRKQKSSVATRTPGRESRAGDVPIDRKDSKSSRHTLYIQMQLCSAQTLGDFLSNKEARMGPKAAQYRASSLGAAQVDIPWALRHFLQIVRAVQHVHQRGLIHRDLKPSNCFIDESGVVKVGDFGLSRESNNSNGEQNEVSSEVMHEEEEDNDTEDNTVGVGTRSYASPEQMVGSDYDSKTDIYALGIMLFELLYPMYTGMERHICFQKVRSSCTFPDAWNKTVKLPFPTLDELVRSMLSLEPDKRPTADTIARHIQGLLDEHSVTLNVAHRDDDGDASIIFVRVEAKPLPDILKSTIQLIHDAASPQRVDVVQYGMRSSTKSAAKSVNTSPPHKPEKRAILEFALSLEDVDSTMLASWAAGLVSKLEGHDEIILARHVWHQTAEPS